MAKLLKYLAPIVAIFVHQSAYAAKKIAPGEVYSVTYEGKTYQCASVRSQATFVVKKKGSFITGAAAKKALKKSLNGLDAQAAKKKFSKFKAKVNKGNQACRSQEGSASLTKISRALTRADVQYLLDKAGLGLSSREESYVDIGVNQGIDALINSFMSSHTEPSGLLDRVADELDGQIGSQTTQSPAGQRMALLDLWINTNNPYQEKFALFMLTVWTVAGDVIEDETFRSSFWDYYQRLRAYAYSNDAVPDLGLALSRDPLMLIYLNNELNVKGNPNENFARELMELFSLGPLNLDKEPNYTETKTDGTGDIAVAARLLTGWKVQKDYNINKLVPSYVQSRHEPGPHTMFVGKPYAFTGENDEDLIRGIFANHPGAKNYYSREILKLYVTPEPSRALVEAFGNVIYAKGFRLQEAMKVLLSSEAFFDAAYRDTVPLNSFEFAAKVARQMEMFGAVKYGYAEAQLRNMGIQINYAPSVFWYNPNSWNSSSIALEKANYISEILDNNTAQNAAGWTAAKALPSGAITNDELINAVAAKVGLQNVNENQRQNIIQYLSQQLQYNNSYTPFTYNNLNLAHQSTKGMGVFYLLFLTPEFNQL